MKMTTLIRTGSCPARANTPLGSPGGLGGRRVGISFSSPPPSSRVLQRVGSERGVAIRARVEEVEEEVEYSGGGMGKGRKLGGRRGGEGQDDGERNENGRIGEYYQELLRDDPSNPLLLRNYGKFLHEVEGDVDGAEECYGRAILASPGDGEVLSLYGKLVWEAHRDEERAGAYFERAVEASPDDCYVMGSYAHFLWDAEEEDEEDERKRNPVPSAAVAEAF